jgi:hypothetical protein
VRRPLLFFFLGGRKVEERKRKKKKNFVKIRRKSAQKTNELRVRTEKKKTIFSLSSAACVIYTKTVLAALYVSLSLSSLLSAAREILPRFSR